MARRSATLLLSAWASVTWSYGLVATDAPPNVLQASPMVKETVVTIRPDMTVAALELAISQLQSNGSRYNQSTIDELRRLCNGCITAQQASITAVTVRYSHSPTQIVLAPHPQSTLVRDIVSVAWIIESRGCAQVAQNRSLAVAVATAVHTRAESDMIREQRALQRMSDHRSRTQSRLIAAQRAENNKLAEIQSARNEMARLERSSRKSIFHSSKSTYQERKRLNARIDDLKQQHQRLKAATNQARRVRTSAEQEYNQKQAQIAPFRSRMDSTSRLVSGARGAAITATSAASTARQRAADACASRLPGVRIDANFD